MRAAIRFSHTFSVVIANASGIAFPEKTACSLYPLLVRPTPRLQVASRSVLWLGSSSGFSSAPLTRPPAPPPLAQPRRRLAVGLAVEPPAHPLQERHEVLAPRAAAHRRLVGQLRRPRRRLPVLRPARPTDRAVEQRRPQVDPDDQRGTVPVPLVPLEPGRDGRNRRRQLGPTFQFHACSFVVERAPWTGTARGARAYAGGA